ncbi:MAG TPA: glutamate-1-semialdehyde 2,1-aminomutase [Vicinamibacteria bacterium]|nr:glutamate-1-semialdehyde 2,1-aminomutase [Vicinamibacteria bacterium]
MSKSQALFEESKRYIPGGVNSPVRAFRGIDRAPRFMASGRGPYIRDVDGVEYIDYIAAYGPLILGHAHPRVLDALREALGDGTSFGTPTAIELEMAKKISEMVPTVEMVRMVSSGTEATLSAIRLARAVTGRDAIIKFEGCYHGHADSFLIRAGSGAMTTGVPDSAGVPPSVASLTSVARFNDLASFERVFEDQPDRIAAVIVEPVAGNMGVIAPREGFLQGLRRLCTQNGALLVFDEVMTGFRVSRGGAQELYGVSPDLTTLGKVIGGGLPVGAYGGRRELMSQISPSGPVYQAGTLSGNPLAMSAGLAQLETLDESNAWVRLEAASAHLERGAREIVFESGFPVRLNRVGSMMTLFFSDSEIIDFESATEADTARYARFFVAMLEAGIHLPPSQYEAWFVSLAHTTDVLDRTLEAIRKSLRAAFASS